MRTVKSLREALAHFPDDATCYAYEGEVRGVIVTQGQSQLGAILASEDDTEETVMELRDASGQVWIVPDDEAADFLTPPASASLSTPAAR